MDRGVPGSNPKGAAELRAAKIFVKVMSCESTAGVGRAEPLLKLGLFRESVPVDVRLAASEQIQIMGRDKVFNFSDFVVLAAMNRETADVAESNAEGRV